MSKSANEINKTYNEAICDLSKRPLMRDNYKIDSNNFVKALDILNHPENSHNKIQIVGTNGKGSTSYFIHKILMNHNLKVGLFTSPHLIRTNERIIINDKEISNEDFGNLYNESSKLFNDLDLNYFERLTLLAALYFKKENCDFVVYETGLGGRLDSVTSLKPDNVLYTSISLDHIGVLGNTVEEIAIEKSYVIKNSKNKFFSSEQIHIVSEILLKEAKLNNIDIEFIKEPEFELNEFGTSFSYNSHEFNIPMFGGHYAKNAILALKFCEAFLKNKFNLKHACEALNKSKWQARLEIVNSDYGKFLISSAHNEDSLQKDIETINALVRKKILNSNIDLYFGVSKKRDGIQFLNEILNLLSNEINIENINIVKINPYKDEFIRMKNFKSKYKLNFYENINDSLKDKNRETKNKIVIGSIYLAGMLIENISKTKNPEE